jgi:hypothetical protein
MKPLNYKVPYVCYIPTTALEAYKRKKEVKGYFFRFFTYFGNPGSFKVIEWAGNKLHSEGRYLFYLDCFNILTELSALYHRFCRTTILDRWAG